MPIQIEMPRLSDTMEEGTLVKWRVAVGDKVNAQDVIADVETDKATMEVPVFDEGTIARLAVDEGATVPVGEVMCVIAEAGEDVEAAAAAGGGEKKEAAAQPKESTEQRAEETSADGGADSIASSQDNAGPAASSSGSGGGRVKISPLARKLADEHGVDVNAIEGSGPGGRIIKRDVLEAAKGGGGGVSASAGKSEREAEPASTPAPKPVEAPSGVASHGVGPGLEAKTVQLSGMRKTIARRLVESKTGVPHFQVSVAVAMDELMSLRATINGQLKEQGVKISVNDFVMKAIAMSCVQHPVVNASFGGDEIVYHGSVNVGVAIALPISADGTGGGLLVATVRGVESKGLRAISNEVKTLAGKARSGGLSPQEMADSTIAISNLGMPQYGVTSFSAIVNPPNAAIIAVGAALEKAVVRDGQLAVGLEMSVTLSGDHRVIDGAVAGEYLATLRSMLENPASLLV
ncbi:dihydrolipoamide acetyltransferase family protein [Phycisphaera mikurensis]|uniref:Dihydrolipoamide acetyltransferase component of pyruvate dehydrogenase complex n=1 Tax=Phycisphaera mikurensis (strain NBRC 102666 / KCTC 22515 / FYK2301M01) TaxID=1142394 RepID=I0IDT5_PHYMF|nr:dihydrolipoamide acetyltransferase family protein [Phycisphaera mikurensis]MBB6441234.1 pyruvate dehydrogenase E2 component (dihydrolipoamide acetyltransferase) [Phycisphaera mikurensis]BAM03423.1 putative pyruvate dehydrogenase E2 component [Phycisphaera mikurensis NBRC 102666]